MLEYLHRFFYLIWNCLSNTVSPSFVDIGEMKTPLSTSIGSKIGLTCRLAGRPVPEITWFKNDAKISVKEADKRVSIENDVRGVSTLRLSDVLETDAGRYTCRAQNKMASMNYTYTVNVIDGNYSQVTSQLQLDV